MSGADTGSPDSRGGLPEYEHRRESPRVFDVAVADVERSISRHGFCVRVMHDIQATLAAKGFRVKPIRIYEIEGTRAVVRRLCADSPECGIERLMPCRISIFVEGESTVITALRPTLLSRVFPEDGLGRLALALERLLVRVVDDATV